MSAKRPYDIMQAVQCHCVPPHGCDCTEARVHAAEMTATFNLRWDADMRAIKRWQAAHPGTGLVWPDHADLVVWLMEQHVAASPAPDPGAGLLEALADANRIIAMTRDHLEKDHPDCAYTGLGLLNDASRARLAARSAEPPETA